MKKAILIFFLMSSAVTFAQDILMQNGTATQCSGVLYDSGGEFANYSSGESLVFTICPENPGELSQLDFTDFNIQAGADSMTIYNGDSTAAPAFGTFDGNTLPPSVRATSDNGSGCITVEFTSDASGTFSGWAATISCFLPCQTINSQIDTATPAPNGDGYIWVCPNEDVTLTGSGVFSLDGTGATYEWDLGDGNTITGQTATFSYATPGVYIVNLNIRDTNTGTDPLGCTNNNLINQVIQVATEPDFTGTQAANPTLCFGDTTTIDGVVNPVEFLNDCTPPVSGITFLPDGSGAVYETSITVDCYDSSQTLDNIGQLVNICINMEHSYLGDLDIEIISPNGQVVRIHDQQGSGSANLGEPWATGTVDGQSNNTTPGVGYDYCFEPNTGNPTLVGGIQNGGTFTNGDGPGTYTDSFVPAGTYSSLNPLSGLLGSPLNGNWTIRIVDNISADNGHVFSWGIEFDPALQPPELSFTPTITSEAWDTDATITNTTGNTITVAPPTAGTHTYTYRVTDDFGCEYTYDVDVEVLPEIINDTPSDLFLCNPGAPPYIFDLTENTPIILTPSPNAGDLNVTYHETQADADGDVNPIPNPDNYTGTDGQIIYVRVEYLTSGCYESETFTLNITSQPTINPVGDMVVCDDSSNDGTEPFNLESQSATILGAQSDTTFIVTYHTSFNDADMNVGALTSPYNNVGSPQPIFVRVQVIGDSACNNVSVTPLFNLIVNPANDASFTMTATCDGGTATITGDVGGTFAFNPIPTDTAVINSTTGTVTGATSGASYTIEYTVPGTCPATSTQTLTVLPEDDSSFTLTPTCDGATANITGVIGGTFVFNPIPLDTAVINPLTGTITGATPSATYTVEYTTVGICPSTTTQNVTVLPAEDASFTMTSTCDGGLATITGDTGGVFTLNPDPGLPVTIDASTGTIIGGTSGVTYTVVYTTLGSCSENSTQNVTVSAADDASFTVTPTCDGATVNITGTLGGTFALNPVPTDAAINPITGTVTGGTSGASYTIEYTTPGVCSEVSTETFNVFLADDASFTIAPTCDGGISTVTGLSGGTFAFNPLPGDTAAVNPLTGVITGGTSDAVYTLEYTTNGACPSTSMQSVTVHPAVIAIPPTALEVCDDGVPDGLTSIDLTLKNLEITGNNPDYSVSYYLTQVDADTAMNPLAIPYTNTSNGQMIYVRVQDVNTGCYATTTLVLVVEQAPVANTPTALDYCDPDSDGFGVFMLTDRDIEITGGDPSLTVSYHETMSDANTNVNALASPYNNIVEDTQTLYVRVESSTIATSCATFVELVLVVNPTPQLGALPPTALEACDDISADGFAQFDLTSKEAEILQNLADPTQYTVTFYENQVNADTPINAILNPGAYTNTATPNQLLWVRVDDNNTDCYKLTTLELIVNPLPVLIQPSPLELCDDVSRDGQEAFTLEDANDEILNGQTGITLTYYETQLDADNGTSPISSPYVNVLSNPQTIFIRAENDVTGCVNTTTLLLRVNPIPSPATLPSDLEVCDDDNDGFSAFDLELRTVEIINGELDISITYHETQADAESGDNALVSPYTNIVADEQQLYIRAENTITGCYNSVETMLTIRVLHSPEVPVAMDDYVICDTDADGIAQFDLTTQDAEVLGTQLPADFVLTYHLTQGDTDTGANPIINVGNYTNLANPQTIYVRLVSVVNGCITTGEFDIRVELPPTAVQPTPLETCDDLNQVNDGFTTFDLTSKDAEITGGEASWSVSYYETDADAQAQTNAIDPAGAYTNTVIAAQTLFVVVTDTDTGCVDFTTLTIRVIPNPTPTASGLLPSLELCDDTNPGDMAEAFDLTTNEALLLNGEPNVTPTYHETEEDALAGVNAIADPTAYTNTSATQTIYVRVTSDLTGCYTTVMFTIIVNPLPVATAVTDYIICELNNDGQAEFDLTSKDAEVLNGQDPLVFTVSYHISQADADTAANGLVSPYTNVLGNPQTIYVAITNTVTGCMVSTPTFNIEVQEAAEANSDMAPILYEICDDEMDDDDDLSNNSAQFDLTPVTLLSDLDPASVQAQVLDGQDPSNYILTYYATEVDAELGVNPLPFLYENTSVNGNAANPQVIYVRVDNDTQGVALLNLDLAAVTTALDFNGDGNVDTIDTDGDGVFDLIDVNGDNVSDGFDTDGDGLIDFIDIDGDGLGDLVDLNNDGTVDNAFDSSSCYAVAPLTLQVNPLPVFNLDDSYILCVDTNGTEVLDVPVLDTGLSTPTYTFEWSLNGVVIAGATEGSYTPSEGGTYSVIVTDVSSSSETMCESTDSTEVIESSPPTLEAAVTTDAFSDVHIIEVTVLSGLGDYEFSLDGGSWQDELIFTDVSLGSHLITARDKIGCGESTTEVTVMDYPKFFTPNGDGYNDTWNITRIDEQPSAKIYIFDRYGKLLKQISPTGDGWNGTYQGEPMPTSDYWFVVEYNEPNTGDKKEFKAHFTLKR